MKPLPTFINHLDEAREDLSGQESTKKWSTQLTFN